MGAVEDGFNETYRDFNTDGVKASGVYNPEKSDQRALGGLIEEALAAIGLGSMVAVAYSTSAELDGDLAHDPDTVGLVYSDADPAANGLYVKSGGSGAGAWAQSAAFQTIVEGLAQPFVTAAEDAAALASRFANDDLDGDVAGGEAGDRGAKFFADQAAAAVLAFRNTNPAAPADEVDHEMGEAFLYGATATFADEVATTRASEAIQRSAAGLWTIAAADDLARTDRGTALGPTQLNLVNSALANAAAGKLPSGWSVELTTTGLALEIGEATVDGLPAKTLRIHGTISAADKLRIFGVDNGVVGAAQGDQFSLCWPIKTAIVDAPDRFFLKAAIRQTNSVYTDLGSAFDPQTADIDDPDTLYATPIGPWTVPDATAAFVRPFLYHSFAAEDVGTDFDVTFTLVDPVLVKGGKMAPDYPIRPAGATGAVLDDADYPNEAPNTNSTGSGTGVEPTDWELSGGAAGISFDWEEPILNADGRTYAVLHVSGSNAANASRRVYFTDSAAAPAGAQGETWLLGTRMYASDPAAVAQLRSLNLTLFEFNGSTAGSSTLKSLLGSMTSDPAIYSVGRTLTGGSTDRTRGALIIGTTGDVPVDVRFYFELVAMKDVSAAPQPAGSDYRRADDFGKVAPAALRAPASFAVNARPGYEPEATAAEWRDDTGDNSVRIYRDANSDARVDLTIGGVLQESVNCGPWHDRHRSAIVAVVERRALRIVRDGDLVAILPLSEQLTTPISGPRFETPGPIDLVDHAAWGYAITTGDAADWCPTREWVVIVDGDSLSRFGDGDGGYGRRYDAAAGLLARELGRPVQNLAVPGEDATQVAARVTSNDRMGPGVCVIVGAGRNGLDEFDTIIRTKYQEMADYITAQGGEFLFWAPTTAINEGTGTTNYGRALDIRDWLEATYGTDKVARVREALVADPLNDAAEFAQDTIGPSLMWDGNTLHPNEAAQATILQAWKDKLVPRGIVPG